MEDRYQCPNVLCGMEFAGARQTHKLAIPCPGCGAMMKYKPSKGMQIFGLATLYRRGKEEINAEIRKARGWKRPGEV